MHRISRLVALFMVLALILPLACTSAPATPLPAITGPPTDTGVSKAPWQLKWETVLAEGKKEGKVVLYTIWGAQTRGLLAKAFQDKFGIELEVLAFSRGPEITARANTEQRAGLKSVDIFGTGPITLLTTMKPEGLLGPIEPLLILPEVTDTKMWRGGVLPLMDKEGRGLGMSATAQRYILRNTDLIKDGEITSYADVLKPQYKGKIALDDPTVTGAGASVFAHMAMELWDLDRAKGFLRDLLVKQEVAIVRDRRTMVEWVARGKYSIGLGPLSEMVAEFINLGSPIALVPPKEGTAISTGGNGLGISPNLAHPNATTVFVNWILSKEGQSVFVRGVGAPSGRVDVQAEGLLPMFLPQPGEKIFPETEKVILFRGEMVQIAKEIIAAQSK